MESNKRTLLKVLVAIVFIVTLIVGVAQLKYCFAKIVKDKIEAQVQEVNSGKPVVVNLDTYIGQQVADKTKEQPTIVITDCNTFAVWNTSKDTNHAIININKK